MIKKTLALPKHVYQLMGPMYTLWRLNRNSSFLEAHIKMGLVEDLLTYDESRFFLFNFFMSVKPYRNKITRTASVHPGIKEHYNIYKERININITDEDWKRRCPNFIVEYKRYVLPMLQRLVVKKKPHKKNGFKKKILRNMEKKYGSRQINITKRSS